jgi:hypothetical protein
MPAPALKTLVAHDSALVRCVSYTAAAAAAVVRCRLHNAGIQVILDVVYNHTAELDDKHPYLISMRCATILIDMLTTPFKPYLLALSEPQPSDA